jgi:CheY-like chemotaxis protein
MKRILIAEDDEALRDAMLFDCRRRGYEARGCASGNEALEIVLQGGVDLVFSDWRMPDGDGEQLLAQLKALPQAPPIIFITGLDELSLDDPRCFGAFAVFNKPFDRAELFKAAEKAVNSRP